MCVAQEAYKWILRARKTILQSVPQVAEFRRAIDSQSGKVGRSLK
jgi:hypothetical protein